MGEGGYFFWFFLGGGGRTKRIENRKEENNEVQQGQLKGIEDTIGSHKNRTDECEFHMSIQPEKKAACLPGHKLSTCKQYS